MIKQQKLLRKMNRLYKEETVAAFLDAEGTLWQGEVPADKYEIHGICGASLICALDGEVLFAQPYVPLWKSSHNGRMLKFVTIPARIALPETFTKNVPLLLQMGMLQTLLTGVN